MPTKPRPGARAQVRPEARAAPRAVASAPRDPEAELNATLETLSGIREEIADRDTLTSGDSDFLMAYGRFLSQVVRDRRTGTAGKLAGKSLEDLLELAKTDPDIREAIEQLGLT